MPLILTDVVVDLSYGDCGKGKVTHALLNEKKYTHVLRYNGGCNAGHTIYHNGRKFVTHHIPAGVFYGIKSIIGSGCVVNTSKLTSEIKELTDGGIDCTTLRIANNAHMITEDHLMEDSSDEKIGTTKRGNGPAYRDKYARTNPRAEDNVFFEFMNLLVDLYEELHGTDEEIYLLCEGAQGFGLDIDWGDYPYVTSSHCTTAGALLNGIPWHSVRHVYGVIKAYETYVGAKDFDSKDPLNQQIRHLGQEYGATTGRPRQINWLDIDLVKRAAVINGITHLIVNKMDILQKVDTWKVRRKNQIISFDTEADWKNYIIDMFPNVKVIFSYSPEEVEWPKPDKISVERPAC